MESIINQIFTTVREGMLLPVASGLLGVLEPALYIAVFVAAIALIFGFSSMQRGAKIAVICGLVVLAVVIPYIPDLIAQALSGGSLDASQLGADQLSSAAEQAAGASPATLDDLAA